MNRVIVLTSDLTMEKRPHISESDAYIERIYMRKRAATFIWTAQRSDT